MLPHMCGRATPGFDRRIAARVEAGAMVVVPTQPGIQCALRRHRFDSERATLEGAITITVPERAPWVVRPILWQAISTHGRKLSGAIIA